MMRTVVALFLRICYKLGFTYKFLSLLQLKIDSIYSLWISNEFKVFGRNGIIKRPFQIIGGAYFEIGNNLCVGKNGVLEAWDNTENSNSSTGNLPNVIIGDNVSLGEYCHITAIECVKIGNNLLTGRFVTITDNSHGLTDLESLKLPPLKRPIVSKGAVTIKDNVWIGDKVTILPDVTIGEGAVIAANSVVTKDVPPYSVVGGIPAKILHKNK